MFGKMLGMKGKGNDRVAPNAKWMSEPSVPGTALRRTAGLRLTTLVALRGPFTFAGACAIHPTLISVDVRG